MGHRRLIHRDPQRPELAVLPTTPAIIRRASLSGARQSTDKVTATMAAIRNLLADGPAPLCEIVACLDSRRDQIKWALKIMRQAGEISVGGHGWRLLRVVA